MSQRTVALLTALLTSAFAGCSRHNLPQPAVNSPTTTASAKDYYERGVAASENDDTERAIAEFSKALEMDPGYVEAYVERGYSWWTKRDFDAALKDLNRALELGPRNARAYLFRGMAKAGGGDSRAAIEDYNKAIEIDPNNADAYRNRGSDRIRLGDEKGAQADYEKTLEIDPGYGYAYVGLGFIKQRRGDFAGAIANYWKATEVESGDYQPYNALAWIFATCPKAEFRDGKRAVELGLEAAKLTKDDNPYVLGTLGAAYAESGNFAEAIKYQQQALSFSHYDKSEGDKGRLRVQLYQQGKPYRDTDGR